MAAFRTVSVLLALPFAHSRNAASTPVCVTSALVVFIPSSRAWAEKILPWQVICASIGPSADAAHEFVVQPFAGDQHDGAWKLSVRDVLLKRIMDAV